MRARCLLQVPLGPNAWRHVGLGTCMGLGMDAPPHFPPHVIRAWGSAWCAGAFRPARSRWTAEEAAAARARLRRHWKMLRAWKKARRWRARQAALRRAAGDETAGSSGEEQLQGRHSYLCLRRQQWQAEQRRLQLRGEGRKKQQVPGATAT